MVSPITIFPSSAFLKGEPIDHRMNTSQSTENTNALSPLNSAQSTLTSLESMLQFILLLYRS